MATIFTVLDEQSGLPGRWFPPGSLPGLPDTLPSALRERGAFMPDPLPSEVTLHNETWTAASAAQEMLGRLDVSVQEFPRAGRWARQAFLREIHASAQLDNVMVPWREALVLDASPPVVDGHPFAGYLDSGGRVSDAATGGLAVSTGFLSELGAVMAGTPGTVDRWRTTPAWLGGREPGKAVHILAPPGPELMVGAEQWCTWKDIQKDMPAAVKCALLVPQLVLLSPFPGSAHIARLAIQHELVTSKVLSAPVLPLSVWLCRKSPRLSRLIREVVDHGDFNDLVTFFAMGIRATCKREMLLLGQSRERTAARTNAIVAKMTSMVTLIEALSVTPLMTMPQVADACDVSLSQAANLVRQLVDTDVVMCMDTGTLRGLPDDNAYRRFIYLPEMIRGPLDTFPRATP